MFYPDVLALVIESLEGLKEKLKAWKGVMESRWLKTKMMIISEKIGKLTKVANFPSAIFRKCVAIPCLFYKYCVLKHALVFKIN